MHVLWSPESFYVFLVPHLLFEMSALYSHPDSCILHLRLDDSYIKAVWIHLHVVLSAVSAQRACVNPLPPTPNHQLTL